MYSGVHRSHLHNSVSFENEYTCVTYTPINIWNISITLESFSLFLPVKPTPTLHQMYPLF